MLVIPAIDLLDGKAVRLVKGDYNAVTSYADDPVALAKQLAQEGIQRLHLVDLDAAKGKGKHNREIIARIRHEVSCDIEVGGGIRSQEDCKELLDIGVTWLIIGTAMVKTPDLVASWINQNPGHFIAGIDALDGEVKVAGWLDGTPLKDVDLGSRAKAMGFSAVIYTNISRDGTLMGPDIPRTLAMAKVSQVPVILSGGIGSKADIEAVAACESKGIMGFISGKAMYEGRFQLKEVLSLYPQGATHANP